MISPRQIAKVTMTPEKKKSAKNDYFAYYIGRPISYIVTIPFLYTKITPNTVSLISIIPLFVGFILMYIGDTKLLLSLGWLCFFTWFILDGVDGNIARYKKISSNLGSVYDAMSGYIAMVLSFFAWGIAASHNPGILDNIITIPNDIYIILGALSGICVIFPRFIMHKVITTIGKAESTTSVQDKSSYGILKTIALNIISISGFVQIFLLVAIWTDSIDLFTVAYFCINFTVMIITISSLLKSK